MNWWLHGLRLLSQQVGMSPDVAAVLVLVMGVVMGFLIELLTSVVFRARLA